VIKSFRHKRLARYFEKNERRGIDAKQSSRIKRMLDALDQATSPEQLNMAPAPTDRRPERHLEHQRVGRLAHYV